MQTKKIKFGFIGICMSTFISGCFVPSEPELTNLSIPQPTTEIASSPALTTTDIKKIVAGGMSLTFNNRTAGTNAIALSPTNQQPAIAYYDQDAIISGTTPAGALKYAYRDSSGRWTIEVVDANYGTAACGTSGSFCIGAPNAAAGSVAQLVSLAFTSSGTPGIAYFYGSGATPAVTAKQVRYAERSAAGVWTISAPASYTPATNVATAVTVDPLKGIKLLIDSSDRPQIFYGRYHSTITSSTIQSIGRSTAGTWGTETTVMTIVTGVGTITAVNQGITQIGAAFCSNGALSTAPRPIVTGTVTTAAADTLKQPIYANCTALAADGSCSTWNSHNTITACGGATPCINTMTVAGTNAGARTDIIIDPNSQQAIMGIYSAATPATSLVTAFVPQTCDNSPTTGAGALNTWTISTVNAASGGVTGFAMTAQSAALNLNQIFFHNGTGTGLSVMKSPGTVTPVWGTATGVDSIPLVAGQGIGSVFDATNDIFYTSYAAAPASAINTVGNDIKVAAMASADIGGTANLATVTVVDQMSNSFPATGANVIPTMGVAKDSSGNVGYVFYHQDATAADAKLYYGKVHGSSTSPEFTAFPVANFNEGAALATAVGSYPSLVYDSNDSPVVAFYNGNTAGAPAEQYVQVATTSNGGTQWSITSIDRQAVARGQHTSLVKYSTSLGLTYYDQTNTALKYAQFVSGQWKKHLVSGVAGASCNTTHAAGTYSKLVVTSSGLPVIAYLSNDLSTDQIYLAIGSAAVNSTTTPTFTCVVIDSSGSNARGNGIDMVLDSSDIPHIVHFDATTGNVRYVTCSSAVGTCISTGAGAFTASTLAATGITGVANGPALRPTIGINSSGTVYAGYHLSGTGMMLATKTSTGWTTETLEAQNSGSSYLGTLGQYPQMLINASGYPTLLYRSAENWIRFFNRITQ